MGPDKESGKVLLHVGCGSNDLSKTPAGFRSGGWSEIRLDIDPATAPDVIGSITDMSAVAAASVDAVYSSHNIEHLFIHEVPVALKEFLRVLKPQGFLSITCPDLMTVVPAILEGRLHEPLYSSAAGPITPHDVLFGYGRDIAVGKTYMAHKCGFTLKSLAHTLSHAGFAKVFGTQDKAAYALHLLAAKSPIEDAEMQRLAGTYLFR